MKKSNITLKDRVYVFLNLRLYFSMKKADKRARKLKHQF